MPTSYEVTLAGEILVATAERALWWPAQSALLLADLHAGKAGHFRRYGLAVPGDMLAADLARLDQLVQRYEVRQVIILGDLFHSEINAEWAALAAWRGAHEDIRFILVRGNHDRFMSDAEFTAGGFEVASEALSMGPFILTHAPLEANDDRLEHAYNLAGHLHPAVWLRGRAHLAMRRPCYWFGDRVGVLPAFGRFTGALTIHPAADDTTIAVGDKTVIRL